MKPVTLVEMGLRDGLQNETAILDVPTRVEFARRLSAAGLKRLEVAAFVRADWVPQMAGSADIIAGVQQLQREGKISADTVFSALVPNERGMQSALQAGLRDVAVFASTSESFSRKNINCSIDESFTRFEPVMKLARAGNIKVRGYLSTCFGCPFEGDVPQARVVELAARMRDLGVAEVSIGDTIGVAAAGHVESLFKKLLDAGIDADMLVGHFHDTRGQAVANIMAAWQLGINTFDTSVGGLGGCPYAPGATGNVATEDVVYAFESLGVPTGIDLDQLIALDPWVSQQVGHPLPSRVSRVGRLRPLGRV